MEYGKIISVTGIGGLFELVGSKKDGAIVRSLEDKSTRFVASRIHNFSHLESIEVYTERDNENLVEVFKAMAASSEALPSEKDNAAIKAYFQKVYPAMDFERVYTSDMKKMVKWFSVLQANDIELKLSEQAEEEGEETVEEDAVNEAEETNEAVSTVEKPKEKKAKKSAEAEHQEPVLAPEESTEGEAAPKKKATRKKKSED